MTGNWRTAGAAALGREIAAGRADPAELTDALLDAAATHRHGTRIFARMTATRARAEAAAARARARAGTRRGPLDGVPLAWKDLFDSAGTATEAGSALLAGRVPGRDAEVLARATRAGGVCLGKTHMSELAFSGLGLNPVTATPPCINDEAAVAGGSSSGSAAAVAAGLAPAALGSDTGGSVRVPAAWNDLVGLKTTHGRLPLTGVVPLAPHFDTVGPITRTVGDAALLLAALEGGRAADLAGASLAGVRLLVLQTVALDDLDGAPGAGFRHALTRLSDAGATITESRIAAVAGAGRLVPELYTVEAWAIWGEVIEAAPDAMYPPIRERFRAGQRFSGSDYARARARLVELRRDWAARTAGFDAVLVPTTPNVPPAIARLETDPAFYREENLRTLRNTRIANLMEVPALTLPTGVPSAGISLMGRPGREGHLLRLGAAAERALA